MVPPSVGPIAGKEQELRIEGFPCGPALGEVAPHGQATQSRCLGWILTNQVKLNAHSSLGPVNTSPYK